MVPTQEALEAFRLVLAAELTALCVALQGHLDELFRRQQSLEHEVAALNRLLRGGKKVGPRQRRVET